MSFSVTPTSTTTFQLSASGPANCDGIYYYLMPQATLVGQTAGPSSTVNIGGYSPGTTYQFAAYYYQGVTYLSNESGSGTTFTPAPPQPSTPSLSVSQPGGAGGAVTLSWSNVGANGYQLFRNGSSYTTTSSTSASVPTPGVNATDSWTVRAYNSNAGGTTYSPQSNTVYAYGQVVSPPAAPSTPTLTVSQPGGPGTAVTLTWNNVGATGYEVRRNGSAYTTTSNTSYGAPTPAAGVTDTWTLRAYNSNAGGTTYSSVSNAGTAQGTAPPAAPVVTLSPPYQGATPQSLVWAVSSGTLNQYIYKNGAFFANVSSGATSYQLPDVATDSMPDFYSVVANNAAGNSPESARYYREGPVGISSVGLLMEGYGTLPVLGYTDEVLADEPVGYWRPTTNASPYANLGTGGSALDINSPSTASQPTNLSGGPLASSSRYWDFTPNRYLSITSANTGALERTSNTMSYSAEFWIRRVNNTTGTHGIITQKPSSSTAHFSIIMNTSNNIMLDMGNATNASGRWNTNYVLPANVWTHIVLTFDGATNVRKLYTNGFLNAQVTQAPSGFSVTDAPLTIGAITSGTSFTASSYIDHDLAEIAIYPGKALSAARVAAHYDARNVA